MRNYERERNEMFRKHLVGNDYYVAQAGARDAILTLYNSTLFVGALAGIANGLEAILK